MRLEKTRKSVSRKLVVDPLIGGPLIGHLQPLALLIRPKITAVSAEKE